MVVLHQAAGELVGLHAVNACRSQQLGGSTLPDGLPGQKVGGPPQPGGDGPLGLLAVGRFLQQVPDAVVEFQRQRAAFHIAPGDLQPGRGAHPLALQQPDRVGRANDAGGSGDLGKGVLCALFAQVVDQQDTDAVGVGQLFEYAHIPVVGGVGAAGRLDAAHFLQCVNDHQTDAGVVFQRRGDLGLQPLPDAAAAGLEQQVGAAALAVDLQQAALDAVEGVLQTQVENRLGRDLPPPDLPAAGNLQAEPETKPAFARLAGPGQDGQARGQQIGDDPAHRRDGGIPECLGVYGFGFVKIRHSNIPFACVG